MTNPAPAAGAVAGAPPSAGGAPAAAGGGASAPAAAAPAAVPAGTPAAPAAPATKSLLGGEEAAKAAAAPAAAADGKPAEGTPAEAPPAAAPIKITLPEGFKEAAELTEFKELAGKNGWTSEQAQGVVDLFVKSQRAQLAQFQADRVKQRNDWEGELKADPEFGGDKFDTNVQAARRALKAYGGNDLVALKEFFSEHPIGNFPPLVRTLARVGAATAEGALVGANQEGGKTAATSQDAFLRTMYPTMFAKK